MREPRDIPYCVRLSRGELARAQLMAQARGLSVADVLRAALYSDEARSGATPPSLASGAIGHGDRSTR